MKAIRSAVLITAGAALGLASLTAGAASCPTYEGVTFTVTTAPTDATCHDYGSGNVGSSAYEIGPVTPPPDGNTPPTGDDLQIPVGYAPIDQTDKSGEAFDGAFVVDQSNGTFEIKGLTSTLGFIVVFKQATFWAAFLLPAGETSGSYSFTGGSGAPYGLSHATLFGSSVERTVPLPAAAWLLGSGLLGLFAVGRRRKSAPIAA
jgi:hypothetical protein